MWKSALVGALVAVAVIAAFLTVYGPAVYGPARVSPGEPGAQTVKSPARKNYYMRNGVPGAYRIFANLLSLPAAPK